MSAKTRGYQNMAVEGKDPAKDNPNDVYNTPLPFVRVALGIINDWQPTDILDPGAGNGVWGQVARELWPDAYIAGVELRQLPKPSAYDTWHRENFLFYQTYHSFDLVMGNPPYGVSEGKKDKKLAEKFVRRSLAFTRPGGRVYLLLKSVFTEAEGRMQGLFKEYPPLAIYQSARRIPFRPETNGNKTNTVAYSMFLWEKDRRQRTEFYWFDWKTGEVV